MSESKAEKELREAWNEMHCCDDVELSQPLASAISELQAHRERAERRVKQLERNNSIMAEQLKKRDGFWLAPDEPDLEMLASVDDQNEDKYLARGRAIDSYQAMRSNWLGRQK